MKDGVAVATLAADDGVCPAIGEYAKGVPRRADHMTLRCVLASPASSTVPGPVLLCDWQDATTPEVEALRLRDAAPRPWILLGSGNGLRIKVTGAPPTLIGEPTRVSIAAAPDPVDATAWQRPF